MLLNATKRYYKRYTLRTEEVVMNHLPPLKFVIFRKDKRSHMKYMASAQQAATLHSCSIVQNMSQCQSKKLQIHG
jgi:hypothetical protein